MFEVFLFINPIGIYCYDTETLIKKTIGDLDINVTFHFVPVVNASVIKEDIIRRTQDDQPVNDISKYSLAANQALLDYHAIKLNYGNKVARSYVIELQHELNLNFQLYSRDLPKKIGTTLGIKFDVVRKCNNNYILDSIKQDKKLISEWNIEETPTTIIFNEDGTNTGVLLEGRLAQNKLASIFSCDDELAPRNNSFCSTHLRLI